MKNSGNFLDIYFYRDFAPIFVSQSRTKIPVSLGQSPEFKKAKRQILQEDGKYYLPAKDMTAVNIGTALLVVERDRPPMSPSLYLVFIGKSQQLNTTIPLSNNPTRQT